MSNTNMVSSDPTVSTYCKHMLVLKLGQTHQHADLLLHYYYLLPPGDTHPPQPVLSGCQMCQEIAFCCPFQQHGEQQMPHCVLRSRQIPANKSNLCWYYETILECLTHGTIQSVTMVSRVLQPPDGSSLPDQCPTKAWHSWMSRVGTGKVSQQGATQDTLQQTLMCVCPWP